MHFEQRYPNGAIGGELPSASEAEAAGARAAAAAKLAEYSRFRKADGREVLIDGKLHTLIAENLSRGVLVTFRRADRQVVEIRLKDAKHMTIAPVPET